MKKHTNKKVKQLLDQYDSFDEVIDNHLCKDGYDALYKGEISNEKFINEKSANGMFKVRIFQCDIDGDSQNERVIFVCAEGTYLKLELYIEKRNDKSKGYELVYDHSQHVKDKWENMFSYTSNDPSVVEIKGVCFIAKKHGDNAIILYQLESENNILKEAVFHSFDEKNEKPTAKTSITSPKPESMNESIASTQTTKNEIIPINLDEANNTYFSLQNTWISEMLGKNEQSEDDFWHRLHSSFQFFNSSYKETPEDITKGLKDLSWHERKNFALFIWNADQLMQNEPEAKKKVLEILENEIIKHWKEQDEGSFSVYLVN